MKRLACILLIAVVVYGQARPPSRNGTLREFVVTVRDASGRTVPNLRVEDFQIERAGVRQEIVNFSTDTHQPASIGLLVDARNSMAMWGGLVQGLGAIRTFLRSVASEGDEFFVMSFSSSFTVHERKTKDVNAADKALRLLYPDDLSPDTLRNRTSSFEDALRKALSELQKGSYPNRALVVATDDFKSGNSGVLRALREFEVTVYVIGFPGTNVRLLPATSAPSALALENQANTQGGLTENWLTRIAETTGGRAELFVLNQKNAVERTVSLSKEIGIDLRGQYRLGYYSADPDPELVQVRVPTGQFTVRRHMISTTAGANDRVPIR